MKLYAVAMQARICDSVFVSAGWAYAENETEAERKAMAMCKVEFPGVSGYRNHDFDLIEIDSEVDNV